MILHTRFYTQKIIYCTNAKFYVAPMYKQNIYLLERKNLTLTENSTPGMLFILSGLSANRCQLFEGMNVKYLLGGTCCFSECSGNLYMYTVEKN